MARGIPHQAQKALRISYKGELLNKLYVADFLICERIVLEIKAIAQITSREEAQVLNYLKATGLQVGLLINFGNAAKLEWKRIVRTHPPTPPRP